MLELGRKGPVAGDRGPTVLQQLHVEFAGIVPLAAAVTARLLAIVVDNTLPSESRSRFVRQV